MATIDVIKCCTDSIRHISDEIRDAIVYLDAGSTESFEFLGAFSLLLELGAHAICSLEKMSPLDKVVDWNSTSGPAKKIVVITSRLLSDAHRYILRCLSALQTVCSCAIFTCISETGHSAYPESPLGPDAYREYESLLVQDYEELAGKSLRNSNHAGESTVKESVSAEDEGWSQLTTSEEATPNFSSVASPRKLYGDSVIDLREDVGKKLKVSVHHFPLVLCPFSPRFFVLPSEGSVAEAYLSTEHDNSMSFGLPPISTGTPADGEDVPPGAILTAQFLYHLAAKMDLKLEIFSLGDISKTVGKLLTDMSSLYDVGRRKRSAGLLLVDRTLDLLTPCCHGDSLVDRMFSSLPRRERMSPLSQAKSSQSQLKLGPAYLQRSPLTVQIPLNNSLREETSSFGNFQLVENIEAFLRGWSSRDSTSQMVELVNLSAKLSDEMSSQDFQSDLLCGSFVSTENFHGTPYLEAILERRTKDGAVLIKKWLQESLRRENLSLNVKVRPGYVSQSDLQPMIKALAKSQSSLMKNKGIIQLAAAALYALDESHSAKWDAFNSAEKILNVNAGDTSQSLAAQISDLINKSAFVSSQGNNKMDAQRGLLTLQDALLLTVVGYILAGENFPSSGTIGPFSWQEEHFMKEAIVDAIVENPTVAKLKFLQGLTQDLEANFNRQSEKKVGLSNTEGVDFDDDDWGSWGDEDAGKDKNKEQVYGDMQLKLELCDRVDNLFKFFHKLSSLKKNISFREWSQALESKFNDDPYSNKGLLYKVLSRVLAKHEVPGLEYHSSTVGRLFKSGFGRFGLGQAKPSLADQDVILVFVVGGINSVEVREAQEALSESSRPEVELIIGGTTLLTPNDMFELLLGDCSCV
ncbi:PREDICTED: sec1 family domain-containing protein MIP3 [Nicotiana attenuata]|uniref:Sec1 family domain-containing protein mip3 n=1 Tax=Nicotiana attenuata TaxID=49451 RepID=A0A1J6I3F8_NICAT|nr:PREDICTED: sec1 family domain-containing protein MIP3 [Nicotiana attenuata]OIS99059.1 sec1 family domain-containing protein mip3 [Nicotiana attenuata]